jgi:hypothetical protein
MGLWLTRLSDDHGFTDLALSAASPEQIADELFLRAFTRRPAASEREKFAAYLSDGFTARVREAKPKPAAKRAPVPFVSWSNHLDPKANEIKLAIEAKLREGDPPTERLDPAWRMKLENAIWAVVNSPEMIHRP